MNVPAAAASVARAYLCVVPARFRIAPTPSGYLHLGNGVNFALTAALAHAHDAELGLRIDDLDAARVREAYRADVGATLRWLFPGGLVGRLLRAPTRQSDRRDRYAYVLAGLRQNGLVFGCDCTRRELAAARAGGGGDVNVYPGTCAGRALDLDADGVAWRMRASGVVVRQKDRGASYQLASLTDDVDLGVTHLVRGGDLRDSTALQRVLAQALTGVSGGGDWPDFGRFGRVRAWHHPLLTDAGGRKLSKSAGDSSLAAVRARGGSAAGVFGAAGRLLGVAGLTDFAGLAAAARRVSIAWT